MRGFDTEAQGSHLDHQSLAGQFTPLCPRRPPPTVHLCWAPAAYSDTVTQRPASACHTRHGTTAQDDGDLPAERPKAARLDPSGLSSQCARLWDFLAFRSYFEIFNGPGEVDAQSLKNMLLLVGFSLTPAQVEDVLVSADVDGDGHVDFKDFLAVMTDSKRFFCSVEQNALANMAPPNPHTLLFEILSLLVEMLALPEAALEEITK
ncbi:Hypothetical predicted protein [Marmota monax]|uniref:EF-hand domain-containing protein n=1 Tax=Marmota monax TaxID=9995 RepID=A0A5E4A1U5_MARMO|nr:hypothetical protein GHT09_002148 [Marmota monax]VTJ50672.1 Hypothetical predicted protein [Marmota monax]